MIASTGVIIFVLIACAVGILFALMHAYQTSHIKIEQQVEDSSLLGGGDKVLKQVAKISRLISEGADAFLFAEYFWLSIFVSIFGLVILILLGVGHAWSTGIFSALAFVIGALTSITSGYLGMRIAVYANSRTAVAAQNGFQDAFITAFKAGSVMGFALVSLALLILFVVVHIWALYFSRAYKDMDTTKHMYECIAGYGLGGSAIALFGRVGGGIYTKAADVGADLCKIDYGMEEDSPDNPAVIADNVGDNVGDIAGMGADLFGSFAESTCAAMVIAAQSSDLYNNSAAIHFPLVVSAAGIFVSLITTFFATQCSRVDAKDHIEPTLKRQLLISTVLMTPVVLGLCYWLMPHSFAIGYKDTGTYKDGVLWWYPFICISLGLWSGLLIGYTTEYFTSNRYHHVQELSHACEGGNASFNIILGLALGYKSVVIPIFALALTIYVSYSLAGMYGIALAAIGILSTLCIGLTIDAYGPICDNAGGIAEMSGMEPAVRQRTDALDAAGNTTAAIGKGFAIGSAAFVSLALFGAFVTTVGLDSVDLLNPAVFAGLLVGAMLPYWFSALTMKSVGTAARAMSIEVGRQLGKKKRVQDAHHADAASDNKEGDEGAPLIAGRGPDYKACIKISTDASLKEMVAPGLLVMLTPILVGFLLGVHCLAGVLTGALVSGVQVAVSASNSGGAWDNAKKFVEGELNLKHTAQHAAAVVGDTVGDPLKDTSGPSLNILIKLMAIISLVFAPSFPGPNSGGLISQALHKMFNWY